MKHLQHARRLASHVRSASVRAMLALLCCSAFGATAAAQQSELLFHVHCSNVGGLEGQGKIDSPRKIEVDIEYPNPNPQAGDPPTIKETVSFIALGDATARLCANRIASKINGKGTDPTENCQIESTNPSDDFVTREHEIKLTLPDGVTVSATRVKKRGDSSWVVVGKPCNSHISVTVVKPKTIAGLGVLELERDGLEGFGLSLAMTLPAESGGSELFSFYGSYEEGTPTSAALIELASMLVDAGFQVAIDETAVWITGSPLAEALDVRSGAWAEPPGILTDDPEAPPYYGEPNGWVGAGASFTPFEL